MEDQPHKRVRAATRPIPPQLRRDVYLACWDLAWSGHCYRLGPIDSGLHDSLMARWGSGSLVARRHGLTILWLTALAGRFNELARVHLSDVVGNTVELHRSKGGAKHLITVDDHLIRCTEAWHRLIGVEAANGARSRDAAWARAMHQSNLLLPSSRGGRMDCDVFNRDVAGPLGRLFGLRLSSHCFRDTACQEAMAIVKADAQLDVRAVQALMGHRSIQTTEHYLRKAAEQQLCLPLFNPQP